MTPEKIVKDSFKGFDDIIEDKDLREWYRLLIVTCIKDYSEELQAEYDKLKDAFIDLLNENSDGTISGDYYWLEKAGLTERKEGE